MSLKPVTHADGSVVHRHMGGVKRQKPDPRDRHFAVPHGFAIAIPTSEDLRSIASPIRDQGQLGSCTAFMTSGAVESKEILKSVIEIQDDYEVNTKARVVVSGVMENADGSVSFLTKVSGAAVPAPVPPAPPTPTPVPQHKLTQLSTLYQYYQTRVIEGTVSEDSGASIRDAIKAAAKGCVPETAYPYVVSDFAKKPPAAIDAMAAQHKVTAYHSIADGDLLSVKTAISSGYFVCFGFSVYSYFMSQAMATKALLSLPSSSESQEGGHAVCAVGYDDNLAFPDGTWGGFLVRNSWGTNWGQGGYFWMSYGYFTKKEPSTGSFFASDLWVIETAPVGF